MSLHYNNGVGNIAEPFQFGKKAFMFVRDGMKEIVARLALDNDKIFDAFDGIIASFKALFFDGETFGIEFVGRFFAGIDDDRYTLLIEDGRVG